MQDLDEGFYDRADAHINLSNDQITAEIGRGKVIASFMCAVARFNAWVSACGWSSSQEMNDAKDETIEYFVSQYRQILEGNLDDYIDKFNEYMKKSE